MRTNFLPHKINKCKNTRKRHETNKSKGDNESTALERSLINIVKMLLIIIYLTLIDGNFCVSLSSINDHSFTEYLFFYSWHLSSNCRHVWKTLDECLNAIQTWWKILSEWQTTMIRVRRRVTQRLIRIQAVCICNHCCAWRSAPNCIKDFLDLPGNTGKSGLTLQLFPVVILVNQVWRYNCFHWKQL